MRRRPLPLYALWSAPAPERGPVLDLGAPTLDGLRGWANDKLARRGDRARVVSCSPDGVAVYVEVPW
jgi:hypothetical protein